MSRKYQDKQREKLQAFLEDYNSSNNTTLRLGDVGQKSGYFINKATGEFLNPLGQNKGGFTGTFGNWVSPNASGVGTHLSTAGGLAIGSQAAGMLTGLLAGGNHTAAGDVMSKVGDVASMVPGPYGAMIGGALKTIGGLTNAAFGSNINEKFIASKNAELGKISSQTSNATTTAGFMADALGRRSVSAFSQKDVGTDGWFANKAKSKFRELAKNAAIAEQTAVTNFANAGQQVNKSQAMQSLGNLSAFGGSIELDGPVELEVINGALRNQARKSMGTNNMKLPNILNTGAQDFFSSIGLQNNSYKDGGPLETNGTNFSTGLVHIRKGGTHEENPNDGVPLGVDNQGVPNLLEQGEIVYTPEDYVFSMRLKTPKAKKYKNGGKKNNLLSYDQKVMNLFSDMYYADAAKKAEKITGANERPNDPISQRGLKALVGVLMESQEKARQEQALKDLLRMIQQMSPEEFAQFQQQMQQEQMAQQQMLEQQMAQEQMAQQQSSEEEMQAQLAQMSPEEQQAYIAQMQQQEQAQMSPQEQMLMQQQMQGQQMAACGGKLRGCGGKLFGDGGPFDSEDDEDSVFNTFLKEKNISDFWELEENRRNKIYKEFAKQYLRNHKDYTKDTLDAAFTKYSTTTLNDRAKERRKAEWLGQKISADDFKNVSDEALQNFAKRAHIDTNKEGKYDRSTTINNIVNQYKDNTRTQFNSLNPNSTSPEVNNDIYEGNVSNSIQSKYDWGNEEAYNGTFGTSKGNTPSTYRNQNDTNSFWYKDGKLTVGDKSYDTVKDYELSDDYLDSRYELFQAALNPKEGDALSQYSRFLDNSYGLNHNKTYENSFDALVPKELQEDYRSKVTDAKSFRDWVRGNYDALYNHGNRLFDQQLGERHLQPGKNSNIPTQYYIYEATGEGDNAYIPVNYDPDKNIDWTPGEGGLTTHHNYYANWIPITQSNAQITLSPSDEIIKGTAADVDAASGTGGEYDQGTPFPKIAQWPTWAALGLQGIGLGVNLYNALNPDYSNLAEAESAIKQAGRFMPVKAIPAGERMKYTPLDVAILNNAARNANLLTIQNIANGRNGNVGMQMAGTLGQIQNYLKGIGENIVKVDEGNFDKYYKSTAFNGEMDKFNSQIDLEAQKANQDAWSRTGQALAEANLKYGLAKEAIKDKNSDALALSFKGIGDLLGTHQQNLFNNQLLGWRMQNFGEYTPTQRSKYGG